MQVDEEGHCKMEGKTILGEGLAYDHRGFGLMICDAYAKGRDKFDLIYIQYKCCCHTLFLHKSIQQEGCRGEDLKICTFFKVSG